MYDFPVASLVLTVLFASSMRGISSPSPTSGTETFNNLRLKDVHSFAPSVGP